MDKKNKGLGKLIKRELFRAALERSQSMDLDAVTPPIMKQNIVSYRDVEEQLNVPYMNREETPLAMDIFSKKGDSDKESPVIVLIHGGGLYMGDRKISRPLGRWLAHRGYLVFSVEYRLAPRVNVCQELDDVCAGLDLVGQKLVDYNVDFSRIYLMAESAGAYLATYVTAMHDSPKLQEAIGHEPSRFVFKALGLTSGMFHADAQGESFAEQIYGEKTYDEVFRKYMNPEHPEIINNLPPVFLMTSRGDFMNNSSFIMHEALKKAGKTSHLLYFGEENLTHAFCVLQINNPKCEEGLNKMLAWFEEQTLLEDKRKEEQAAIVAKIETVTNSIKDESLDNQKVWEYIKKRNSIDEKSKKAIALIDCAKEYTYEQLFNEWNRYARVFSGLNITGHNKSRVALAGVISAEPLFAFYGLNMTGAQVSMLSHEDFLPSGAWKELLKKEKTTDLIISDTVINPFLWMEIQEQKETLGLRNVILLHSKMGGPCINPMELINNEYNYHSIKSTGKAVFMEDLFDEYEDTEISYGEYIPDNTAVITHNSETDSKLPKALKFTDKDLNKASSALAYKELFGDSRLMGNSPNEQKRALIAYDFNQKESFSRGINGILGNGNTAILTFFGALHHKFPKAAEYYNATVLAANDLISLEENSEPVRDDRLKDIYTAMTSKEKDEKNGKPSLKEVIAAVQADEEVSEIVGGIADKLTVKMMKMSGKSYGMKDYDYDIEE